MVCEVAACTCTQNISDNCETLIIPHSKTCIEPSLLPLSFTIAYCNVLICSRQLPGCRSLERLVRVWRQMWLRSADKDQESARAPCQWWPPVWWYRWTSSLRGNSLQTAAIFSRSWAAERWVDVLMPLPSGHTIAPTWCALVYWDMFVSVIYANFIAHQYHLISLTR